MDIKKTALYDNHVNLGAKMVEFAGFSMPVRYTSVIEEHRAVRERTGVFDVSHMGEFMVQGPGALRLLERISSNDPNVIEPGQAQYSCMPNNSGGIVDDFLIYCMGKESYMLVVNASNIEKDWDWIHQNNTFNCSIEDISDNTALLAIQGPGAAALLQKHTDTPLDTLKYYRFTNGSICDVDNVIISATGYTGSGGFELYIPNESAQQVWSGIFSNRDEGLVVPAGLGARDTLRLEMGFCLYGNDIDDTTSPLEAGLGWITKFNHDFVNSVGLAEQKEAGIGRRLVGIEMMDRGIPRAGYPILNSDEQIVGQITSGTMSPMLDKGIGLAYIDKPFDKKGTEILVGIRKKKLEAKVVRPPFYKP